MDKLEKKKRETNNMAHLVSIVAIVALILCLGLILCIRAAVKNGKSDEEELAMELMNGDSEEMAVRLEEVQKNLETLESAVNDSTSTINTLYKSQDEEKRAQLDESLGQLQSIEERLMTLKTNLSTLMETVNSNEEYDTSVMIESFVKLYADVDKLKGNLDDVLKNMLEVSGENQEQLLKVMNTMQDKFSTNMNSMQDKLSSNISSMENKFTTNMTSMQTEVNNNIAKTNDGLTKSIEETKSSLEATMQNNNSGLREYLDESMAGLAGRLDKVDEDINSVFQYVASGKRGLASSLATIGTPVDIDAETGNYNIETFETLMNKIEHSQDISGTVGEGDGEMELAGACAANISRGHAGWVCGQYIVGTGEDVDEAYNQGYGQGYAEGLERANSANVLYTLGHVHTGGTVSSNSRNGCYESRYEYYTYTSTMHETCTGEDGTSQYCAECGASLSQSGGITWGVPGCRPHTVGGYHWVGYLVCGLDAGAEVRQTTDLSDMTANEKILRAEISFP